MNIKKIIIGYVIAVFVAASAVAAASADGGVGYSPTPPPTDWQPPVTAVPSYTG